MSDGWPRPHKQQQSLTEINMRVKLPFVCMHYPRSRRHIVVRTKLDTGKYQGYYVGAPDEVVQWSPDVTEFILLASYHGS